ncbi:hypothetical protein P4S83_10620 [Aneurinibacillus thermoaerophilus]|uniref:hypothetical protein n=1 Tax=Aneurinibacillus thermoaerophilus TaxID=143495 RepID=UPI002E1DCABE|nr:hypothetical protein [Aneurinibacillus thermoaerophilus]MED0766356.1 hypothetical protein [Aneurinibacillus thermoaerophilus]
MEQDKDVKAKKDTEENRVKAEELRQKGKPKNLFVGILFTFIWILLAYWFGKEFYGMIYS